MQSESMADDSHLNSISAEQSDLSSSRCVDLNALNPTPFSTRSDPPVTSADSHQVSDDRRPSAKHSRPHISLGTFNMSSSSPTSSPPLMRQATSAAAAARNGLPKVGRPHRPVVRSQSSRISLLRQQPNSASSLTSGTDVEHFPIPDK